MCMILFYHAACYQQFYTNYMNPILYSIISLFVTCGLTAFTFSSGLKLALNHYKDINNDDFFLNYLSKRSLYLYKIYFFYPLICLILYGFLYISKLISLVQPYVATISPITPQAIFDWFLGSVPPIGGHLWFLFVLAIINIIALLLLKLFKLHGIILTFISLLFLFLINPHTLTAICISELPYYILCYLVIYLFGIIVGVIYISNIKHFKILAIFISFLFLLNLISYIFIDIKHLTFPSYSLIKIYNNVFFKWGLTYPCFIVLLLYPIRHSRVLSTIQCLKKDTLYIYLLQYPFVIPFFTRFLLNLGVTHTTILTCLVFLLSLIACILLHRTLITLSKLPNSKSN